MHHPNPNLIPSWIWQRRIEGMLVAETVRRCVVFIGHRGFDRSFIADGTGFIVLMKAYGFMLPYVVTAKHVIDQAFGTDKKSVVVRVNTKEGGLKYFDTDHEFWHCHPDHVQEGRKRNYIDVAAFEFNTAMEPTEFGQCDLTHIAEDAFCTDEVIEKFKIGVGDEVVVPGLFHSHTGTEKNIPVLRTGNIAAMRDEPFPTTYGSMDGYLTELRSVGGISGSPVFLHMVNRPEVLLPESPEPIKIKHSKKNHYLLGLVHGHYTINTQEEWVLKTDQQAGDINAGIALVVPASKIMETICQPAAFGQQVEMAKNWSDYMSTKSGAKADSAPSRPAAALPSDDAAPLANGENPTHREDFTRLVGAAARKRE